MTRIRLYLAGLTTAVLAASSLLLAPTAAQAVALPSPDTVFQDWNQSFLYQNGSNMYYTDSLKSKGTNPEYMWLQALDIQVAEDAYDRTHSPTYRTMVNNLVATYLKNNGKTWTSWDTWNDDIGWGLITTLRGYETSGDASLADVAADQWNKTWARGWTSDAGGGIWEDQNTKDKRGKCALSNDPIALTGVWLFQITGDQTYLAKAEQIYSWVKKTLVDPSSGQVYGCVVWPNGFAGASSVQKSDNAYDQGSFLAMADALYRATGNQTYLADATKTADGMMTKTPIIANNGTTETSLQYWYFKGLSEVCTDAGTCGKYDAYMQSNAAQAWSERNNLNLTWNDWKNPTNFASPDSFMMNSMPGLFQSLPDMSASPFSGTYTLQNVASKQAVSVAGNSTASNAAIVQAAGTSASWSLVPASNGYYWIKDALTGQMLNVTGASAKLGALVTQHPAGSLIPGSDLWKPVKNADGSYSFYNRNSQLALDNSAAGGQLQQLAPNDGASQKFSLTSGSGGAPVGGGGGTVGTPVPGTGVVKSGITGRCLDLRADNTTNGDPVQLWDCNGSHAQSWAMSSDGTMQLAGKCLDAFALGKANGTKIELWDCNGGPNQVWQPYNGGYRNPVSGRCLDDPGSSPDGLQLQLYDCNGTAAQIWSTPSA